MTSRFPSLIASLALVACGQAEPEASASRAAVTAPSPAAPSAERGATEPQAASALSALSAENLAALRGAPTERVLLLPGELLTEATLTSGPHFFAISARDGELTISLHATDVVHHPFPADAVLPDADFAVRGKPARESMNDGIRGITWSEAGMAYSLEVECYEALTDPRCTEGAFLRDLAERLALTPKGGER